MKVFIRYIVIVFLILLTAAGLVVLFQSPFNDANKIGLSELVNKINASEVKEIVVKGDTLEITLNDEQILTSQKESGVSAFESLKNLGANPEKVSATNIKIEDEEAGASMIFAA